MIHANWGMGVFCSKKRMEILLGNEVSETGHLVFVCGHFFV